MTDFDKHIHLSSKYVGAIRYPLALAACYYDHIIYVDVNTTSVKRNLAEMSITLEVVHESVVHARTENRKWTYMSLGLEEFVEKLSGVRG
jgi:hypothetical protein